jgi:predicted transcriptional regulator
MPRKEALKEIIFSCIDSEAVPIFKIAERANTSVQTTSKYCYVLFAEGKIEMQKFGNMQLVKRRASQ